MDLEINQYINPDWLPEGGCTLDAFSELKLEPRKGTFYYYEKLLEQADTQSMVAVNAAIGKGEKKADLPNGNSVDLPTHDWDSEDSNLDEATKRLLKAQTERLIDQIVEQTSKSRGTIPGEISEILKRLKEIEPPKFDWKGYMRRFVGKSIKIYTKKSRRKFNKRLPDFPGLKIKKQKHVLVAIDTSASVSTKELQIFLSEIHHIFKTGSDITIIQCDTAISYIGKFDPKKDFNVHGRGGTDFNPVIDYYNENCNKYSCMFYLTDGEAPAPENCKNNVLWVLTEQSKFNNELPGSVIQLN